jgi:hypothetical protein
MALIASDGERSLILEYVGGAMAYWIGESGCTHTERLWIWEGNIATSTDYFGEHDEWLEGTFRKLTDEEWEAREGGDDLWDPAQWECCNYKHEMYRGQLDWPTTGLEGIHDQ